MRGSILAIMAVVLFTALCVGDCLAVSPEPAQERVNIYNQDAERFRRCPDKTPTPVPVPVVEPPKVEKPQVPVTPEFPWQWFLAAALVSALPAAGFGVYRKWKAQS